MGFRRLVRDSRSAAATTVQWVALFHRVFDIATTTPTTAALIPTVMVA